MKKQSCLLAMCLPLLLMAQETTGIKWTTGLSWEQVKQKAKAENKYIFIDAYTTWCGPCKMMDRDVYTNDTVSNFFNQHFIAVKAQMDVTDNDEQVIKDWYNDASSIEREYAVTAYPSLIFLSPQSTILYKIEGYRPVQKFVDTAKLVLTNGTVYNNPYKEYTELVKEYKKGIKHYDRVPMMIRTAGKLRDTAFARQLFKEYLDYASKLNKTKRYTKENIELWASFILKLDSKALQFFLKDGDEIDKVINQKGYSRGVVDNIIQARIVDSFFRMQKGETTTINGKRVSNSEIMFMRLPQRADGKIAPDYVEADWKYLEKKIRKNFTNDYVFRNVLTARMKWYRSHQNMAGASKMYFAQLDKYPPTNLRLYMLLINQSAWETFLYVNDKKLLEKALEWMAKIIQHGGNEPSWLDTYANLLYKLEHTKEAIEWEGKAVDSQTARYPKLVHNEFKPILEKMKKGEPTYQEQGAIWLKK